MSDIDVTTALIEVRRVITTLDRILARAIQAIATPDKEIEFPAVNVLTDNKTSIDLGDSLPPQCMSGNCNDD